MSELTQSQRDTIKSIKEAFAGDVDMYRAFAWVCYTSGWWPHRYFYVEGIKYDL